MKTIIALTVALVVMGCAGAKPQATEAITSSPSTAPTFSASDAFTKSSLDTERWTIVGSGSLTQSFSGDAMLLHNLGSSIQYFSMRTNYALLKDFTASVDFEGTAGSQIILGVKQGTSTISKITTSTYIDSNGDLIVTVNDTTGQVALHNLGPATTYAATVTFERVGSDIVVKLNGNSLVSLSNQTYDPLVSLMFSGAAGTEIKLKSVDVGTSEFSLL